MFHPNIRKKLREISSSSSGKKGLLDQIMFILSRLNLPNQHTLKRGFLSHTSNPKFELDSLRLELLYENQAIQELVEATGRKAQEYKLKDIEKKIRQAWTIQLIHVDGAIKGMKFYKKNGYLKRDEDIWNADEIIGKLKVLKKRITQFFNLLHQTISLMKDRWDK